MGDLDRTIVNNVSTGENLKDVLQKAKTLSVIISPSKEEFLKTMFFRP